MKYLVDVNLLLALLTRGHVHHARARRWLRSLAASDSLVLSPLGEIGFIRVGLQSRHVPDVATGRKLLAGFSGGTPRVDFLADDSPAAALPSWVSTPGEITDGHLSALASSHRARLATFDQGIPGAFLIP